MNSSKKLHKIIFTKVSMDNDPYHVSWGRISRHNGQSYHIREVKFYGSIYYRDKSPRERWYLTELWPVKGLALLLAGFVSLVSHQAIPITYLCRKGASDRAGRKERKGREPECDFKPIQVSLRLNNSTLQILDFPSPCSKYIRNAILERTSGPVCSTFCLWKKH